MTTAIPMQIKIASAGLEKEVKELLGLLDVDLKTFLTKVGQDLEPHAIAFGNDFSTALANGFVCAEKLVFGILG